MEERVRVGGSESGSEGDRYQRAVSVAKRDEDRSDGVPINGGSIHGLPSEPVKAVEAIKGAVRRSRL